MRGLNKVYLCGYLGDKPKLKQSHQGRPYALLKLATHRLIKSEEGDWKEQTHWHPVFVWGKKAEACHRYLTKGQAIVVEGQLNHYEKLDEENGSKNYHTSISALEVEFLSKNHPESQI